MPRVYGSVDKSSRPSEIVALMHVSLQEKDTSRARDFIARALDIA